MNLGLIASGLLFIFLSCPWKVESFECNGRFWANGSIYTFSNEIFNHIDITRVEDQEYRTQLKIKVSPTTKFFGSSCKVILSSQDDGCVHYSEQTFDIKNPIYIPDLDSSEEDLNPGCNYSLVFIVNNSCIQKYYRIPEKRPCAHFLPEDTYDSFPNEFMDNVTINALKKNAIRLNISFSAKPEYANVSGVIALSSKNRTCDHHEEFSFNLSDAALVIPRVEYPHSFIDKDCEYMVDFELNNGYCLTTTYRVPDLCIGLEPKAKINDVVKEEKDIYKVIWEPDINQTYSIIDIVYSIDDVPMEVFNSHMIIETNMTSNFTLLNFSKLTEPGIYQLNAIFINAKECETTSSFYFEVNGDPGLYIFILIITVIIFTVVPAICMCIPSLRTKIVSLSKVLFGKTFVQVPTSTTGEARYLNMRKKEMVNECYVPVELQKCDEFEFPLKYRKLELKTEPIVSNFGVVYIGRAYGINKFKGYTTVAVKTVKEDAPEEHVQALLDEMSTLRKIASNGNHENVVRMLACCSIEKPYMIFLEFVACGDLKNYLIDLRKEWLNRRKNRHFIFPGDYNNGSFISPNARTISETSSSLPSPTETESTIVYEDTDESPLSPSTLTPMKITPALSNVELQNFALQIAQGMAFLESISVVHRDLAARNVLISEGKILKISDFGMSRIGDYVHRNNGQQPLRWMAPESIEKCTCTSKSDVWSFGVVLWEIGTLGAFPYDSISNKFILEYLLYSLKKGIRLMRPEICTDELYSLMLKCWSENPDDRPNFQLIVDYLSGEKKKIYLDFRKLSPAYVFPPTNQT